MESSTPPTEFVAFDLETTGLVARVDRVVEIGAVRFTARGDVVDRFEQLINPGCPMPSAVQAIHGISDADLVSAPFARDVLPRFLAFLGRSGSTALIAHNASFDAGFLGRELARAGHRPPDHRIFDTLALARRRLPELRNHRLDTLADHFRLDRGRLHRALGDSLLVKGLWLQLEGPCRPRRCWSPTRSRTRMKPLWPLMGGNFSTRPLPREPRSASSTMAGRAERRHGRSRPYGFFRRAANPMSSRSATWILSRSRSAWIESETVLPSLLPNLRKGRHVDPGALNR